MLVAFQPRGRNFDGAALPMNRLRGDKRNPMPIQHRRLGRHGRIWSATLCLGTMNFGWHTPKEDAFKP